MTTAEAIAQIREALSQSPFQVRTGWRDALTALDSLEAEVERLRVLPEKQRNLAWREGERERAEVERLTKELAKYEEPGWINAVQKVVELQAEVERLTKHIVEQEMVIHRLHGYFAARPDAGAYAGGHSDTDRRSVLDEPLGTHDV